MRKHQFSIVIANDSVREKVFAEIYYNNEQWAEISQEEKEPIVIFFPPLNAKYWEFPFEEAMKALEQAKKSLLSTQS